jgi:hypothetical protein
VRSESQLVQAPGEAGLAGHAKRREEQRGHHRRVGHALALLQPADLRLAVAHCHAELPLGQPGAAPQHAQQRAEVGERRRGQRHAPSCHAPTRQV